jgi:hypothetical protein
MMMYAGAHRHEDMRAALLSEMFTMVCELEDSEGWDFELRKILIGGYVLTGLWPFLFSIDLELKVLGEKKKIFPI